MQLRFIAIVFLLLLLSGCDNPEFILQKTMFNCEKNNSCDCIIGTENPHSGKSFCRLDKSMNFGPGINYIIPKEFQGKELRIVIKGWMRSNRAYSNAGVIVSTNEGQNTISWQGMHLRHFVKDLNNWCYFNDSLLIAAGFNGKKYSGISIFALLNDSQGEVVDFDDFEITLKYKDKF